MVEPNSSRAQSQCRNDMSFVNVPDTVCGDTAQFSHYHNDMDNRNQPRHSYHLNTMAPQRLVRNRPSITGGLNIYPSELQLFTPTKS